MARILVTGGAGYIGSHTCKALAAAGHVPVTLDSLAGGHRAAVRWGPLIEADLTQPEALRAALAREPVEAALHFAGLIQAGESMTRPGRYYRINLTGSLNLLDTLVAAGVRAVVFSSTVAVYGNPRSVPIVESHPLSPVNPYGESKLAVERALGWYGAAHGVRWTALRYFNAAGADPDGELGEAHEPESHLIPLAIDAALGRRPPLKVMGTDYPTPDGTAVRDYVHVSDLARAHVAAIERLLAGGDPLAANLGAGRGYSVREVVAAIETATGRPVPRQEAPRRPGDPPVLVADPSRARDILGWAPRLSDLPTILATACAWHRRLAPSPESPAREEAGRW
ncbi:UDP-glucose 4-epimerase GalE [Azospirillum sp.]|uniref:UDP-glucose 4-epimerase GalE n=1 Tax=Azospirillum sp. TaxID=34012 RepID=UPI002D3E4AE5|nr:UDP-glucose 4-epimerase GalE [Azospirillum sp.]HYD64555.1 UDP-glucose 4-epimerase GalE [Azospirillum sp.]